MELTKEHEEVLLAQRSSLEKFSVKSWLWAVAFGAIILIGWYALYIQVTKGHGVTGMRDNVVWGLYIVNFIFFIGISYGGAVFAAILYLLKVEWARPVIRIAQLILISSVIIGPVFIILCVGRLDRLHHLFIYARLQSPIFWDVVAIATYFVGGVLFLYLSLIRDFSIYHQSPLLNIPAWKRKLYKILSIHYEGRLSQKKHLMISLNLLALILVPLVIIVSSILSWIFGMTLRPGWHSTIFGPYFVLAAIYSGVGVIIVMMWFYRKLYKLQNYITEKHFTNLGYIMLLLGAAYGYFTFSEYLTSWFSSQKWDAEVIKKIFTGNQFGWLFLFSNVAGIILPILIVAIPALRKPGTIAFGAFMMILGLWVKRYLIIVPTLETPLLPVQDIRPEYIHYTPTWVEWALTFAGLASFLLFFHIVSKFVTILPIADWIHKDKHAHAHHAEQKTETA